ncbi:hypothetical protein CEUSTIGMA_g8880.t1 [Chlamydomonas eustigma]|uniref:LITAF domain-containing protein n=1 Tax=Chlamydomonas eustigma TaxID=1157962 RepID=A0A250XEI1_9CHLO|nr:hypothetical protein CEUSTIGMA_g8880.t1 [Chlamydomonas eustigma]|eukprot:GAX81451.1 hypothetical protein CEUSTIGMA_g8880.t1 [Chlamydomonas eustigma]
MNGYSETPYSSLPSKGYPYEPSHSHQHGYDYPSPSYQLPQPASPLMWIPPQPFPGIPIRSPRVPPLPGQVLVAYEITESKAGCCQCDSLKTQGVIASAILFFVFWPLTFIPCMMADCHNDVQQPVYDYPPGMPQTMPPAVINAYPAAPSAPQAPQVNSIGKGQSMMRAVL